MLTSLLYSHPDCRFDIYLLHSSIQEKEIVGTREILSASWRLIPVEVKELGLENAPTTERYPREMYYRIFAARYLPETLDHIVYLVPDLIVNGSIRELYQLPLNHYYFAAASHIGALMHRSMKNVWILTGTVHTSTPA